MTKQFSKGFASGRPEVASLAAEPVAADNHCLGEWSANKKLTRAVRFRIARDSPAENWEFFRKLRFVAESQIGPPLWQRRIGLGPHALRMLGSAGRHCGIVAHRANAGK